MAAVGTWMSMICAGSIHRPQDGGDSRERSASEPPPALSHVAPPTSDPTKLSVQEEAAKEQHKHHSDKEPRGSRPVPLHLTFDGCAGPEASHALEASQATSRSFTEGMRPEASYAVGSSTSMPVELLRQAAAGEDGNEPGGLGPSLCNGEQHALGSSIPARPRAQSWDSARSRANSGEHGMTNSFSARPRANSGEHGMTNSCSARPRANSFSERERHHLNKLLEGIEERSKALLKLATEQEAELAKVRHNIAKTGAVPTGMTRQQSPRESGFSNGMCSAASYKSEMGAFQSLEVCHVATTRSVWQIQAKRDRSTPTRRPSFRHTKSGKSLDGEEEGGLWRHRAQAAIYGQEKMRVGLVVSPSSPKKMCWDLISTLVICYDVLVLPLTVFGYDDLPAAKAATLATTLFWSMDLILSFFCGYHTSEGFVEMSLPLAARHYLRTWFPLDLSVLVLDWSLYIVGRQFDEVASVGRINRVVRFVKVLKVLRFVRLVRAIKVAHLLREIGSYILTPSLMTFMNIFRLLIVLSVLVHYIACAWCVVGFSEDKHSWLTSWVEQEISSSYLYAISFHWTLGQFLPAPVPETAKNFGERLFTIFVLLSGFVVFSSTLGSVTVLITQARKAAYTRMTDSHALRKFFYQNKVSHEVASQVLHFQAKRQKRVECMTVKDVPILHLLPMKLQENLMYQVHMRTLSTYPFMDELDEIWSSVVKEICANAISDVLYVKDDIPFRFGTKASSMHFVRLGHLMYYVGVDSADIDDADVELDTEEGGKVIGGKSERLSVAEAQHGCMASMASVAARLVRPSRGSKCCGRMQTTSRRSWGSMGATSSAGSEADAEDFDGRYLSEAALWTSWKHRGIAIAQVTTRIIQINADPFAMVVKNDVDVHCQCRNYVKLFIKRMKAAGDHVDDTFCAFTRKDELSEALNSRATGLILE